MAKDKLRFGIIGCGRIAPRHAKSIIDLSNAEIVAVVDIIEQRACKLAIEYGTTCYTDYRYLLDRKDIDVINICTPNGIHSEMAIEAMQAGKHVIVEKPMALSVQDADKMIAAAVSTRKKMSIVLQNRYNAPVRELRSVIDSGKLGRLLLGNATVRWYRPQKYYEDSWHGTWHMEGGVLMNQAIHHVDVLQWFFGDVETIFCYSAKLAHEIETDDTAVAVLKFKTGALGIIEGSTITYPRNLESSIAVFGEFGSAKIGGTALDCKDFWEVIGVNDEVKDTDSQLGIGYSSVYGMGHKAVIADMIEAIIDDKEPMTNGIEAKKAIVLVTAMYLSSSRLSKLNLTTGPNLALPWTGEQEPCIRNTL